MPSLSSIFHLGLKELMSLARDTALLGLILYAFTYAIYGPAKGAQMELRDASVAVVDEDRSPLSARITAALLPPYFLRAKQLDIAGIDRAMDAGRFTFIVDIPPRFQADVEAGRRPAIQVNVDATAMTQAGRGTLYLSSIISQEIAAFYPHRAAAAAEPVRLVTRAKFNPNLLDTWFLCVSQIINNVTMLALILAGAAVVREREHGTIEHLLVMPLRASEIMLAKVWATSVAIVLAALASLWLVVSGLLDVPIAGSVPLFVLATLIYLFSATSLGILLATVARSMPQFGLLALVVHLILTMLSGGASPLDSMPHWLQRGLQLSPTTHFVDAALAILYRGAGLSATWPALLTMTAIGAGFFALALTRFRRMIAVAQGTT